MKHKVLVTPRTFGVVDSGPVEYLQKNGYEILFNPYGRLLTEDEMSELIKDADGIIVGLDPLTERVLAAAKNLKIISKYGVGVDNICVEYATKQGIMVANTPGTNSSAVAELTMGLILDVARHISYSDRRIRQGEWGKYQGFELGGKILGLAGTGQIGREVALRARGFGLSMICYDINPDNAWAKTVGATYRSLDQLLAESDIISIHLPLCADTYHLISHDKLALMKSTSILINTARGGIVDEEALFRALQKKKIAGAAIDVFEAEPPVNSSLKELENVVMTSHIGSHTKEAVSAMARMAVENLIAGLSGKKPNYLVNFK